MNENVQNEQWAVIELMGHGLTAGMIKASDLGSLLRVDVPVDDGYRTEYYGSAAIYSVKMVSEEIARAYAMPHREIMSYNEPIVPRAQYEEALEKARQANDQMRRRLEILETRLISVSESENEPAQIEGESGVDF